MHNGSMTFVDTGGAVLGLTARHVADAVFEHCSGSNPAQVGAAPLHLDSYVGAHPEHDLAVFALSEDIVRAARHVPIRAAQWPPPVVVVENEVIAYAGYPGESRLEKADGFDSGFLWFMAKAHSVSERSIGTYIDVAASTTSDDVPWSPESSFGGWSGGPVFRIKKGPLDEPELVGIIYTASDSGIVQGHPLTDLLANGSFS